MTPEERNYWVGRMGARASWWDLHQEPVFQPDWPVIDAHVHLWHARALPDPVGQENPLRTSQYLLPELMRDTDAGHRVAACVYIECGSGYLDAGPEHLRTTGEAGFAASLAATLTATSNAPKIAAIVGHADLRHPDLPTVLAAHAESAGGLFRGIRHSAARLDDPAARLIAGAAPAGLSADPDFRRGVAILGDRGLTFDAFQFHFQLDELADLARAVPHTTILINHLGGPVQLAANGPQFEIWASAIDRLADLPNVAMKLGGIASIVTGYDGHTRATPPSSHDFVAERGAFFHHAIRRFGAHRCMFGSNFPVDSTSISYPVLWNAFKTIAAEYPAPGRDALLSGTAERLYRL